MSKLWNYLILTAANENQAAAYEAQIRLRREVGELAQVIETIVVADPEGRRVGSGGSTLQCLLEVLRRESEAGEAIADSAAADSVAAERVFEGLRILIVHAGGDSRRLPAYSPCGKIFVPLPGETCWGLRPALFDRLVPAFLDLPDGVPGAGQIVVASGDALILFDPGEAASFGSGITALGSWVSPIEAARHGVLCANSDGSVRQYLQKPDIRRQAEAGAIAADGRAVLDIGVMSLDASAAVGLLGPFCDGMGWKPAALEVVLSHGVDLYREICCALGTDTTVEEYIRAVRSSGSKLEQTVLAALFSQLRSIPFRMEVLRQCSFLHFGSTSQLIGSGVELVTHDRGGPPSSTILAIGTYLGDGAVIEGQDSWVEGCRLRATLRLCRRNVVTGVDVSEPFELLEGGCLDLSSGVDRHGEKVWFVRYYGVEDSFKHSVREGATFCGRPLTAWLQAAGASDVDIWGSGTADSEHTLWNARVFPGESEHAAYRLWSWMLDIDHATSAQKNSFLAADRYSSAEIAVLVDQDAFHRQREVVSPR